MQHGIVTQGPIVCAAEPNGSRTLVGVIHEKVLAVAVKTKRPFGREVPLTHVGDVVARTAPEEYKARVLVGVFVRGVLPDVAHEIDEPEGRRTSGGKLT